jgi:hypothetical protein
VYEVVTPDVMHGKMAEWARSEAVIVEMKTRLWKNRRKTWEVAFRQDSILIRV